MAVTYTNDRLQRGVVREIITLTAQNDSQVLQIPRVTAMSIQASGTFGAATLDLQGSNDGVTYAALPIAISFAAAGIKSVALADLGYRFYRVIILVAAPGGPLTATIIGMESR